VTYTWTDDTTAPAFENCPQRAIDLGCNPTLPTEATAIAAAGTVTDTCDKTLVMSAVGEPITGTCTKQQVWTVTAATDCGPDATCTVTYTWTDDTTAPAFENCPTAVIDLGSNPTLPTEATAIAAAGTVTDTCDKTLVMTAVGEPITGTCTKQQVWTVTAATDCGPDATCMVTYTWTVETATLSIGTGYTILYPNGNPPNPGIVSPYELAGPGNWVTVPISIANPCTDLAQLVFEINFEAYDTASISPCCDETTDLGLRYMLGTERWDPDRVEPATIWNNMGWQHGTTVDGTDGTETLVQVEYGVAQDQVNYGRVIVYMDSPTGGAVIKSGTKGVFMWVMFRVSDLVASFRTFALTPNVIYATNLQGLEIPTTAEAGAIYADGCNWKLDVDRNGRVDPDTDGVTLYRALKYGHLDDDPSPGIFGCPVVPIVPPDFAELAGEYLPCDKDIVAGVLANLVPSLNVDGKFDGIATAIGGTAVSASRDGTYAYRNLAYFPTQIYPYYLPPGAYSPFVPPVVPGGAGLTVPAAHTNNAGIEPAINGNIDALKVLHCPSFQTQALPCGGSWFVTLPSGLKVLPLPQAAWSCGPP
jgi:hypothetical protein